MDTSTDSIVKTIGTILFVLVFVLVMGVRSCREYKKASKLSSEVEQLERLCKEYKELDEKQGKGKLTPKEEARLEKLLLILELKFRELEELKK